MTDERREEILRYLTNNRTASVRKLAQTLHISEATVRRDLAELQKSGLIRRNHGGAVLLEEADEISIRVRMTEHAREKELAAAHALKYLPAEARTLFLDSSSTVLALARKMDFGGKTVVVNNLETALYLSSVKDIELIVPGGAVSRTGASIGGAWTVSHLAEFRFDLMLASCAAIGEDGAYETSAEQRDVKRAVFERSRCRILVADHFKFSAEGAYLFKPLSAFDRIVLDELPPLCREKYGDLPFCL